MATSNNTRRISQLQAEKSRLLLCIAQIEDEIERLRAEAALAEVVQEVLATTPGARPSQQGGKRKRGPAGPWYEERMINGCGPYVYKCWRDENGTRHSEYQHKGTKPA